MVEPSRAGVAGEAVSERAESERDGAGHDTTHRDGQPGAESEAVEARAGEDSEETSRVADLKRVDADAETRSQRVSALNEVRRKLSAARAVLDEAPDAVPEARQLLGEAWDAFSRLESGSADPGQTAAVPEGQMAQRVALLESAERLESALLTKRREWGFIPRLDIYPKYLAWLALTGVVVFGVWYASQRFGPDVWLARYFDNVRFQGDPVKKTYRQLELDWGRDRVDPKLSHNRITARFETCLLVSSKETVHFWMEAKDGAILKVDGKKIASTWQAKKLARDTGKANLDPGLHHVEVSFYNATGSGRVNLLASFGKEGFAPIDSRVARALPDGAHDRKPAKRCEPGSDSKSGAKQSADKASKDSKDAKSKSKSK